MAAGPKYADLYDPRSGRSRRVVAPARWRPIGYRVGGPSPQPGPNPAAGPGPPSPSPSVTPSPTPGPSPVAPTLPDQNPLTGLGNPLDALGQVPALFGDAVISSGQVVLGVVVLFVGLALVAGSPAAPVRLVRGARQALVTATR